MSDDRHPNERLADSPDPDPVDAKATEPAERPQSRGVTRRALLGGTALGAGLLAYTSDYEDGGVTHSIARAATVPDEPLITVGPEDDPVGYIFESNGDWVFKHEASGNEFFYNSAQDRWEAGSLAIEDANISNLNVDSHEDITGVEFGEATHSNVSASSDDGWDTYTRDTVSVTFASAFSSTPSVVVSDTEGGVGTRRSATTKSTSGFNSVCDNYDTSTRGGTNAWVAIE